MNKNFSLNIVRLFLMALEGSESNNMNRLTKEYGKEINLDSQEGLDDFCNYAMLKLEEIYPEDKIRGILLNHLDNNGE